LTRVGCRASERLGPFVAVVLTLFGMATVAVADPLEPTALCAPEPPEALGARRDTGQPQTSRPADWCTATRIAEDTRGESLGAETTQNPSESVDAGTVRGRLVSCAGSLRGAQVSIADHPGGVVTGTAGLFVLSPVRPGAFGVTIEAPGQARVTIAVDVAAGRITDLGDIPLGDLTTDPEHCGRCETRCPQGASCVYSVCICPDGLVRCGDTCVTLADLDHCRSCLSRCDEGLNMIPRCGTEGCIYSCVEGTADCDSRRTTGCETRIDSDAKNCGGCGNVCAPGQRCVDYTCQ
jgi:hypothetical protein